MEARNTAAPTISSGLASRPAGVTAICAASAPPDCAQPPCINRKYAVEFLLGDVHVILHSEHAGAIHQNIDAPGLPDGAAQQFVHRAPVAHIEFIAERAPAHRARG